MPTNKELILTVKEYVRKRDEITGKKFLFGSDRIDLRRISHVKFEVRKLGFKFLVDEPEGRGGTDKAPNPLAYFIAGAASCLASQYAKLAVARDIRLDDIQLTARGHFDRRIGGSFT